MAKVGANSQSKSNHQFRDVEGPPSGASETRLIPFLPEFDMIRTHARVCALYSACIFLTVNCQLSQSKEKLSNVLAGHSVCVPTHADAHKYTRTRQLAQILKHTQTHT